MPTTVNITVSYKKKINGCWGESLHNAKGSFSFEGEPDRSQAIKAAEYAVLSVCGDCDAVIIEGVKMDKFRFNNRGARTGKKIKNWIN